MRFQRLVPFAYVLGICLCFFWGCQGNKPLSPTRNVSLNVHIPPSSLLKASLLGAAQNNIIYRVDGQGHVALAENTIGPFSTAASYGSEDFSVNVPVADNEVLSIQLNDAASNQSLAVGAVGLNLLSSPVSDVVVEMGSVTRTCYTFNGAAVTATSGPATILTQYLYGGFSYEFLDDAVGNGASPDIVLFNCSTCADNNFYFQYYQTPTGAAFPVTNIAFLGNGNLVDYDYVPPDSSFATDSNSAKGSGLASGDIYCIKLLSLLGGHAWMQVTDPATPTCSFCAPTKLPSFCFRINNAVDYYAYFQTTADAAATCAAW